MVPDDLFPKFRAALRPSSLYALSQSVLVRIGSLLQARPRSDLSRTTQSARRTATVCRRAAVRHYRRHEALSAQNSVNTPQRRAWERRARATDAACAATAVTASPTSRRDAVDAVATLSTQPLLCRRRTGGTQR